jgi:hypothetical protein
MGAKRDVYTDIQNTAYPPRTFLAGNHIKANAINKSRSDREV